MAQHGFSEAKISDQQFPPANAAAWTVPADTASGSDVATLIPSKSEGPQPSAPDLSELPPNYFDISIVPNNAVLHYNEVVPYTEPSKATVVREKEGIMTFDTLVDTNPDQLWLYFMTYLNERPSLNMNIHGYHIEVVYLFSFRRANISCFSALHHLRATTFSWWKLPYACRPSHANRDWLQFLYGSYWICLSTMVACGGDSIKRSDQEGRSGVSTRCDRAIHPLREKHQRNCLWKTVAGLEFRRITL